MRESFVEFSDFVNDWRVDLLIQQPPTKDEYDDKGKLIKGVAPDPFEAVGIILPMSQDDIKKGDNGNYTERDRKVYVLAPLAKGTLVTFQGKTYEIDRELSHSYTDVYRYYALGKGDAYKK
jgi:hypothetical protein